MPLNSIPPCLFSTNVRTVPPTGRATSLEHRYCRNVSTSPSVVDCAQKKQVVMMGALLQLLLGIQIQLYSPQKLEIIMHQICKFVPYIKHRLPIWSNRLLCALLNLKKTKKPTKSGQQYLWLYNVGNGCVSLSFYVKPLRNFKFIQQTRSFVLKPLHQKEESSMFSVEYFYVHGNWSTAWSFHVFYHVVKSLICYLNLDMAEHKKVRLLLINVYLSYLNFKQTERSKVHHSHPLSARCVLHLCTTKPAGFAKTVPTGVV